MVRASFSAALSGRPSRALGAGGLPATPSARGMIRATRPPRTKRVTRQSRASSIPCAAGTTRNWPKEPPAVTMPKARVRFSGGTARPTAPRTTTKVTPAMDRPTMTPKPSMRPSASAAVAATARPAR
ncbi:hypothetical protein D3C85_1212860 [compost metagenome]